MIQIAHSEAGSKVRSEVADVDLQGFQVEVPRQRGQAIGRRLLGRGLPIVVDLLATGVAAFLASLILHQVSGPLGGTARFGWDLLVLLLVVQPLTLGSFGLYDNGVRQVRIGRISGAVLTAAGLIWLHGQIGGGAVEPFGSLGMLIYCAWAVMMIYFGRLALREVIAFAHDLGIGQRRVLVVGGEAEARRVMELLKYRGSGIKAIGRLSPSATPQPGAIATVAELEEGIRATGAQGIVVASNLSFEAFETLVSRSFAAGVRVTVLPAILNGLEASIAQRPLPKGMLIDLYPLSTRQMELAFKRLFDLVASAVLLLLSWPLFLLIAVAIKLNSPGPVFFRQWRPGQGGHRFRMLKFRTMRPDAEEVLRADPVLYQKFLKNNCKLPLEEDPRIFRVGAWLRRTSLDELPQLINVLRGEMALVGPRPVIGPELDCYGASRGILLTAKPGMTGYWQVNGRSQVMYPERAEMDLFYVRNWSLALDFKILLRTIPAVISQRGAH